MTTSCVTDTPILHAANVKKMPEHTRHKPRHAKLFSHHPCVVLWWVFLDIDTVTGILDSLASPLAMAANRASTVAMVLLISVMPLAATAQQTGDDAPVSGIDAIPTDLPVHASTVRDPNHPVSLLPGTIPTVNTPEFQEEVPSLAKQYYQTITGIAPRTPRPAAKKQPPPASTMETSNAPEAPKPADTLTGKTPRASVQSATAAASMANTAPGSTIGQYQIQLGAFHDTISAQTYWASFRIRYPDLAKSHQREIAMADLGSKGVFHRLRLGGFADQTSANEKCRQLIADGTDCFAIRP